MSAVEGYVRRDTCRGCDASTLEAVFEYGDMPLAGGFVRPEEAGSEPLYPLTLAFCTTCGLVQVPEVVSAEVLFRDYRYLASVPLSRHFAAYADSVPERLGLRPDGLIVEPGANDGVLLRPLHERGFTNVLGVDPADNVTRHAPPEIPILSAFFTPAVAEEIRAERGPAQLVAANNVFAHMDEPNVFAAAAAALLEPEGVFAFEVHYLVDLIDAFQYDTVYHEHLSYYSITALEPLLARHQLRLFDVERISNHGGSIRAFACLRDAARPDTPELEALRADELRRGLGSLEAFRDFGAGVRERVAALDALVEGRAGAGQRIAAYGAAGRATILFNVVESLRHRVAYVVDESPERIGRLLPGAHTPIVAPERLDEEPPDLVLISAWSYAEEIAAKVRARPGRSSGAEFCVPLPDPRTFR